MRKELALGALALALCACGPAESLGQAAHDRASEARIPGVPDPSDTVLPGITADQYLCWNPGASDSSDAMHDVAAFGARVSPALKADYQRLAADSVNSDGAAMKADQDALKEFCRGVPEPAQWKKR